MKLTLAALLTSLSLSSFAAVVRCEGVHRGAKIVVNAQGSLTNTRDGSGSISVAGRRVALFDGDQVRINYLTRALRAANDQGDQVQARVTNLNSGAGVIGRLHVPAFGIDYRNVAVVCSLRR